MILIVVKYIMGIKISILSIIVFFFCRDITAQTDNISGVVNKYTSVVSINLCSNSLDVIDASEFSIGDKILIIQMKGAEIDSISNSNSFGNILDFRNAGNYEMSDIQNITGNTIQLQNNLTRQYDVNYFVQLVKISDHVNANVTAELTCPAWDGVKGGVLIIECQNKLTLNANITANSKGFRPGAISISGGSCAFINDYFYPSTSPYGGRKGEGISDVSNLIINGRGKLANGGGGGNKSNTGGGGGGNFGAGGKAAFGWAGTCGQLDLGGLGGSLIPYGSGLDKLFLGGGGGGGHQDNGLASPGSLGGGIILIIANEVEGNSFSIESYGLDAGPAGADGAGGGGAGGTVAIESSLYTTNLSIDVHGGKGGDAAGGHGTGGGGGGGLIYVSSVLPVNVLSNLLGGEAGVFTGTTNKYGSIDGNVGGILNTFSTYNAENPFGGINISQPCNGDVAILSINDTSGINSVNWQISTTNDFSNVIESIVAFSPVITFPNPGTYYIFSEANLTCFSDTLYDSIVVEPSLISVFIGNDTVFCNGNSQLLDPGAGYDFYQWHNGDNSQTFLADTSGQYIVEVANIGENLIFNGDFELGNQGFSSNYTYNCTNNAGFYCISPTPQTQAGGWSNCSEPSNNGGNLMSVNGATTLNQSFWCQTINVVPNTDYMFSTMLTAVYPTNPPILQFSINGKNLGLPFQASNTTCQWDEFYEVWNSGLSTTAEICIVNQNSASAGNDFAIDDIFFASLCKTSDTINVEEITITNTNIESSYLCYRDITSFKLSDTSSMSNIDWFWTPIGNPFPSTPSSTDWEPTIQYVNAGDYAVLLVAYYPCFIDSIYDTITITTVNDVNLGNDTTYCLDGSILTLDAGAGYDYYFWQGVDTTQTYTADTSGEYIVKVGNIGDNLILNGDFEQGNVSFSTEYLHVNCGVLPILGNAVNVDTYTVGGVSSCFGIAGTGNVFHAYDLQTANYGKVFWGQTANISSNT